MAAAALRNVLIINAHEPYPFSPGRLNKTLAQRAASRLEANGYSVKTTATASSAEGSNPGDLSASVPPPPYDVEEEIGKHQWADAVILQSPTNWMGVPWSAKRYMDLVYSAGMDGRLCRGDGRRSATPTKGYGTGGTLEGKSYMLSLTFNAPAEAFGDGDEYLFEGKTVDDLWMPQHCNFKFFGMAGLPTFVSWDVMKNPDIEGDFARQDAHIDEHFPPVAGGS